MYVNCVGGWSPRFSLLFPTFSLCVCVSLSYTFTNQLGTLFFPCLETGLVEYFSASVLQEICNLDECSEVR